MCVEWRERERERERERMKFVMKQATRARGTSDAQQRSREQQKQGGSGISEQQQQQQQKRVKNEEGVGKKPGGGGSSSGKKNDDGVIQSMEAGGKAAAAGAQRSTKLKVKKVVIRQKSETNAGGEKKRARDECAASAANASAAKSEGGAGGGERPEKKKARVADADRASSEQQGQGHHRDQHPHAVKEKPPHIDLVKRAIDAVHRQDEHDVFLDPVTEDIAPGYFSIIRQPMDLYSMRRRAASGYYKSWADVVRDFDLMFNNAMLYNPPDTSFYALAGSLKQVAREVVTCAKAGIDPRSFEAHRSSEHMHKTEKRREYAMAVFIQPETAYEDEERTAAATAENDNEGVGGNQSRAKQTWDRKHGLTQDDNRRASYEMPVSKTAKTQRGGKYGLLLTGTTGDGIPFLEADGRVLLRPTRMFRKYEGYAQSACRFASVTPALHRLEAKRRALQSLPRMEESFVAKAKKGAAATKSSSPPGTGQNAQNVTDAKTETTQPPSALARESSGGGDDNAPSVPTPVPSRIDGGTSHHTQGQSL